MELNMSGASKTGLAENSQSPSDPAHGSELFASEASTSTLSNLMDFSFFPDIRLSSLQKLNSPQPPPLISSSKTSTSQPPGCSSESGSPAILELRSSSPEEELGCLAIPIPSRTSSLGQSSIASERPPEFTAASMEALNGLEPLAEPLQEASEASFSTLQDFSQSQEAPSQDEVLRPEAIDKIILECATDGIKFGRLFFPRSARQTSPEFHYDIWSILQSLARLVNIQVFRGGGKTTLLRIFLAHRIAYGISRTIIYVGKSEEHAIQSLRWLKNQIIRNVRFASTFGLRQGTKWTDNAIEIFHGPENISINILALGITGSIRGVNIDDYRPDLIIADDIINEENSATELARDKMEKLILGALVETLVPRSEDPSAKMVLLQTPMDEEDFSMKALQSQRFTSARFPIFTKETLNAPLAEQESSWEGRWPSEELRKEKLSSINDGTLAIFLREKELRISKSGRAAFRPDWLRRYEVAPEGGYFLMAIDPVPPPTPLQRKQGLLYKDYEAITVVQVHQQGFFIRETIANKGHFPDWTISEFLRLANKYNPRKVIVETISYQGTLAWLLRQAMNKEFRWWAIHELDDKRKKVTRIIDALHGPAANGKLFFPAFGSEEAISQFINYPDVAHEDILETIANCITAASASFEAEFEDEAAIGPQFPMRGVAALEVFGDCP